MNTIDYLGEIDRLKVGDFWIKENAGDSGLSGNAWISKCTDLITKHDKGILTSKDVKRFLDEIKMHNFHIGHYWRAMKSGDDQNHDDIIAIVTTCLVLSSHPIYKNELIQHAHAPGIYGLLSHWVYRYTELKTIRQYITAWWRPPFGPTDYFATVVYNQITLFSWLRLYIGVWSTSLKNTTATSGRRLDWFICRGLKQMNIGHAIVRSFENKIRSDYAGKAMGEVFAINHRDVNHPFAREYDGKVFLDE